MTAVGWDEDDDCTGPCCRPPAPVRHNGDTRPMNYPNRSHQEEPMTAIDRELAAMNTILDVLAPLTPDERKAAITRVWEHYEARAIVAAVQVAEEEFGLIEDAT